MVLNGETESRCGDEFRFADLDQRLRMMPVVPVIAVETGRPTR